MSEALDRIAPAEAAPVDAGEAALFEPSRPVPAPPAQAVEAPPAASASVPVADALGTGPAADAATHASDLEACRQAIRHGSRSFHAASRLLPRSVREPALALYAFCRSADDAVDEEADACAAKARAVARLRARLAAVYAGRPEDHPADRAMAAIVERFEMPRALPEALIEGFEWDAEGRTYETLAELHAYGARVAGAVGAMMTVLMGVRDRDALARACDMGCAMQLTNIARDVGEDARAGRLFLPKTWLREAGIDPDAFLADSAFSPALGEVVLRLLKEADRLYSRARGGVSALPPGCRPAIHAAGRIYAEIGAAVRANGCDSVSARARTTGRRKAVLAGKALSDAAWSLAPGMPRGLKGAPLPQTAFLVEAAARARPSPVRPPSKTERDISAFVAILAELEARDRAAKTRR